MSGLSGVDWSVLVFAALLVGFAKTAIGGVGTISVALFATVLPARESTGTLLPLLLLGDVIAVYAYRRHADWPTLLRLLPSVAAGIFVGVAFVALAGDAAMRRTIGAVLLGLLAIRLGQRRRTRASRGQAVADDSGVRRGPAALAFGLLAGFTTMVANAGGPVMSLYLLSSGLGVLGFLGTGAWFFLVVNAFKLPFSAGLGLISPGALALDALLAPALFFGAALGRALISRIDGARFEQIILVVTAAVSLNLLLR